jgi:hypothetical protein
LLESKRHQREIGLIHTRCARKIIDEGRNDPVLANPFGDHFGNIDMGVDVCLRIHFAESFDDFLAASHANKPVMNDGDFHSIPFVRIT